MNNERLYTILRAPHISEKSSLIQAHGNQYVFRVATDASKPEVKAAIEISMGRGSAGSQDEGRGLSHGNFDQRQQEHG